MRHPTPEELRPLLLVHEQRVLGKSQEHMRCILFSVACCPNDALRRGDLRTGSTSHHDRECLVLPQPFLQTQSGHLDALVTGALLEHSYGSLFAGKHLVR